MPKGISIHIGVHHFDSEHYGYEGTLENCPNDAIDMQTIADSQNFESTLLLTEEATRDNVKKAIKTASEELEAGDILFLSYSGHGGTLPDRNNDEEDHADETWCLYDGQLIDDELLELWSHFREGVRVLVVSDSCHSGTVIKANPTQTETKPPEFQVKSIPYPKAREIYRKNKGYYDKIADETPFVMSVDIKATVKLMSGCQDTEYSYAFNDARNSLFTQEINAVWDSGQFIGSTEAFFDQVKDQVSSVDMGWSAIETDP